MPAGEGCAELRVRRRAGEAAGREALMGPKGFLSKVRRPPAAVPARPVAAADSRALVLGLSGARPSPHSHGPPGRHSTHHSAPRPFPPQWHHTHRNPLPKPPALTTPTTPQPAPQERLGLYDTCRNDPAQPAALSNLSPYLHYGQLAPQRAALEAAKHRKQ